MTTNFIDPITSRSYSRRVALKLGSATLISAALTHGRPLQAETPTFSPALQRLNTLLSASMAELVKAAQFTRNGVTFLRPCLSATYNGTWPDDGIWPFLAEPALAKSLDLHPLMQWLTDAIVDLPTVPDRVDFDGNVYMSPGSSTALSERMPLHLPSAWTRYLQTMESLGVTIPRKDAWAKIIQRSFDQVPFSFGLVYSDPQKHIVGFGFYDTIRLTGQELMTSLITSRGLDRASVLFDGLLPASVLEKWRENAAMLRANLHRLYDEKIGGFLGASIAGHQFSVWANGLIYPMATAEQQKSILNFFRENKDQIFLRGCTRQVAEPGGWNGNATPNFNYQQGGFWATGTGFVLPALVAGDPAMADQLCDALYQNLTAIDRAEWLDQQGNPNGARQYLASVSMPLMALRSVAEAKPLLSLL